MIRVIVADDHNIVRQGILKLLEDLPGIEVVGQAATGQQAIELVEALEPEVLVLDIGMPRMDGSQAAERILALSLPTQIVILSMHADALLATRLLRLGVKGYLLKQSLAEELPLAIQAAWQGKMYISPPIADSVLNTLMLEPEGGAAGTAASLLTSREKEVLQLIAEGYTNSAIAEALSISVKTVEKHRANVMAKLDAHDLPTLIRKAIKHGLIFLEG
ncbi:MAG: response regulator [Candidatus Promineifilaceae bacterium]